MNRVLVVAPHPDDEILGCASVLTSSTASILYVTDGVPPGHPAPFAHGQCRRDECAAALAALGATITHTAELGFGDQQVWRHVSDLADELVLAVRRDRPTTVFLPAYQNGHPDHDATYVAGLIARRILTTEDHHQVSWMAYSLYGFPSGRCEIGVNPFGSLPSTHHPAPFRQPHAPELLRRKITAMQIFRSQIRPGSVLQRWLSRPSTECFAPFPDPITALPEVSCFYDLVLTFRQRFGLDQAQVNAELHRIVGQLLEEQGGEGRATGRTPIPGQKT